MIEVRDGRIYFYNSIKTRTPSISFPCLSAYICPHCNKVLAAYYAGIIQAPSFKETCEDESESYQYTFGSANGGQYIEMAAYHHKNKCKKWLPVSLLARGVQNSINAWSREYKLDISKRALDNLVKKVEESKVPGFQPVPDICGADQPILLYNEQEFFNGDGVGVGYEERTIRRDNPAAYIEMLAGVITKPEFEERVKARKSANNKELNLEVLEKEIEEKSPAANEQVMISSYSRKEAIADGVLVDVSEAAKEAGIVYPTALTQTVWDGYVVPLESVKHYQDINGRLWDILTMFHHYAKNWKPAAEVTESSKDTAQIMHFKVLFEMAPGKKEFTDLKAVCGPGDTAEPVLTIMLPTED
jgi:hypothetical protein